jgi:hypothetical protein
VADAVRQHFLAAMARRAAAQDGALRERLEARLATLQSQARPETAPVAAPPARPAAPGRAALAALLEHLERQKTNARALPAVTLLPYFKGTWSRLNADQRLAQSRSTLPRNAGPLNSQHLVHRSLALMRELSPAYFERFVAYTEALLWVEQTNSRPPPRKGPGGRRT